MSRFARNKALLAWPLGVLLAHAPAYSGDAAPQEYLDQETAATITVVGEPLVFAITRTDVAANARDYATLAAAAVDRSGKVTYVVIAYFWSTVDPRARLEPLPSPDPLVLQADDRRIELHLRGHSAYDAGIGVPVHAPPGPPVTPNVYGTDLATVRFIGEARQLALIIDTDASSLSYGLWEDRRGALRRFVRHMSGAG
ncbi:MAG: hypothetical protein ACRETG_04820 [Steroidobacteraceae bacterium]